MVYKVGDEFVEKEIDSFDPLTSNFTITNLFEADCEGYTVLRDGVLQKRNCSYDMLQVYFKKIKEDT